MNKYLIDQTKIIDTIKLLVYKEDIEIAKKIDFDDNNTFLEPLLYSYFNSKKNGLFPKEMLGEILQGYFTEKEKLKIVHSFNKNGIAYLPNIGYFNKNEDHPFESLKYIINTKIELISQPIIHAKSMFNNFNGQIINDSEIKISRSLCENYFEKLSKAFQFIKTNCFEHYLLIEQCCKKIILFKTNPKNTNSFATINAHGIAFLNVYQEDYDEVFFVDDIAHQTGHIILTTIMFERKKYFLIDENENIGIITNKNAEYRSFYILFHALFTYYTTLLCLDGCIRSKCFDAIQAHEARGRIGFYLKKLISDMENFDKVIKFHKGIECVLTKQGIEIYCKMEKTFKEMLLKWYPETKKYDYNNQPYNFSYQEFAKINSL